MRAKPRARGINKYLLTHLHKEHIIFKSFISLKKYTNYSVWISVSVRKHFRVSEVVECYLPLSIIYESYKEISSVKF